MRCCCASVSFRSRNRARSHHCETKAAISKKSQPIIGMWRIVTLNVRTSRSRSRARDTSNAVRNEAFAAALAEANRDRVWTDADQKRMWSRSAIVSVVFLLAPLIARVLRWFFTGKGVATAS